MQNKIKHAPKKSGFFRSRVTSDSMPKCPADPDEQTPCSLRLAYAVELDQDFWLFFFFFFLGILVAVH